jgi:predicted amidohydrolase YtcJ
MKIYHNANIHTLDSSMPKASAIVVDQGRVLAIGDSKSILNQFDGVGRRIDLSGRTIIPGLTDAHIHLEQYALALQKINCETTTLQQCLDAVAARVKKSLPGEWILGHGWNQNNWPEGFGTKDLLDGIAPRNPVYLTAKSLHAGWVNSAALELAGISDHSPDPQGGQIQRSSTGSPTGILFETAMSLISNVIPEPTVEQVSEAIYTAQSGLCALGLTGVHDFDQRTCFIALQNLHAEGKLKLRVLKSIPLESLSHSVEIGLCTGFGDDWLRIGSIKAFADGALGPRTAAMLQPYENDPDNKGILMLDSEILFEHGRLAVESGLSLAVHAIGDLANHEVLKAFAQIRDYEQQLPASRTEQPHLRHRIEHVQIIHPQDISKLAELNVIASMQPIHATSDYPAADQYWGERSRHSYAWYSIQNSGALLAFGSDAPVESPNPFWGLHAAVTRRRVDGSPAPDGWYPEQKLALTDALRGFTSGAAHAAQMEDRIGKLAQGYWADLLVLENDIYTISPEELWRIRPLGTMIAGEWVHLTPELQDPISIGEHPPLGQ